MSIEEQVDAARLEGKGRCGIWIDEDSHGNLRARASTRVPEGELWTVWGVKLVERE
jgi:hypothetical protein